MIPESNVQNLMLKEEVLDAVKAGKFNIYSVKTIDEGIEFSPEQKPAKYGKTELSKKEQSTIPSTNNSRNG